ncbi:hypothetical protein ACNKHV_16330 [Shigella flexneri]
MIYEKLLGLGIYFTTTGTIVPAAHYTCGGVIVMIMGVRTSRACMPLAR